MSDRGDRRVMQLQAIASASGVWLTGKPEPVHRSKEPIATAIASEHSARAICAMSGGGQADDQQVCCGVAKVGDRAPPVFFIEKSAALDRCDLLAMRTQPLTQLARLDTSIESFPSRLTHQTKLSEMRIRTDALCQMRLESA